MARGRFSVIGAAFAVVMAALALVACDDRQEATVLDAAVVAAPEAVPESPHRYLLANGNIRELNDFVAQYPAAPEVLDAQARIAALQQDRSLWEPVAASGDEYALRAFLLDYPGHVAEGEARALLAPYEGV